MLTRLAKHTNGCGPSSNEIPHGVVCAIGNPHPGQFAGAMQFGQHHRISMVGLHAVPGFMGIRDGAATMHSWPRPVSWR